MLVDGGGERIGRYRVTRVLGQGGMGVVYEAHDDRLDRAVAIKVIRTDTLSDSSARERFRREARAAARVSHPNICPLFEFDEDAGRPFLVMELLEGEPLSARIGRGPLPVSDALSVAGSMLDALAALHRRGLLHRDLKPANVFLTPHGVKLVDFGLAQPPVADDVTRQMGLTGPHAMMGTPQYMAPEVLAGRPADERADIFAVGAVIYEMLAGRPSFQGRTLAEIVHAVGYLDPAPLEGSRDIRSIDRVLRQTLAKDPAARVPRADVLAALLRDAVTAPHPDVPAARSPATRFVALPFRMLRPDAETDFLAFSVPDAVSMALTNLESVIVRSPRAASADDATDLRAIGRDLAVDVILTGTLLRSGSDVRVSAQLTDAAAGTILWSDRTEAPIADLFQLQDSLTERIVSSLALPLSAEDRHALDRQAPASAEAYELYMRANQMMTEPRQWEDARRLYERAVALDPTYAPAWARLGRVRRVLAKWGGGPGLLAEAEAAFRRALELDPDLSVAHHLVAHVHAELGRAPEAMVHLLARARVRRHDPELLAGLVTACRYSGLLDASLAAHHRAAAIDAAVTTSVAFTYVMRGDYQAAIATDTGAPPFAALLARMITGDLRIDEVQRLEDTAPSDGLRLALRAHRHALAGQADEVIADLDALGGQGHFDPEGQFVSACLLARTSDREAVVRLLSRAVDLGYVCHAQLTERPEWSAMAGLPAFDALVARTKNMVARARQMYDEAGGPQVLATSQAGPPS